MNSDRYTDRSIPILLLVTTVIAYGLFLPKTGFYWDDWPFAWIAEFLGPREFIPAFDGVRPFLGPIFLVTTSLVPPNPLYWQIFALVIRFISGLSAWFVFRQVWPQHKLQTLAAALLFLLFPGYSQHWVALTHINQEWIALIFFLLSFGCTGYALRHPEAFRRFTALALVLMIPGVFPTEYFVGQGLLRLFFIWIIVQEQVQGQQARILRTLKLYLPYLVIGAANVLWLLYFYTVGNYDSYNVQVVRQPFSLAGLLVTLVDALWKMGLYVWGQIVVLIGNSLNTPSSQLTIVLIAIAFVFFRYYFLKSDSAPAESRTFSIMAILAGMAGILLGRLPAYAAGLPLTLQSSWDRLAISMMLGGSLFVVGWVSLLIRNPHIRNQIFALLIALSVGQQFFNANIFRRDWEKQQQIFWQLAWRIPAMAPGTAILTDELPIDYETDLSFTAPLNWIYAPTHAGPDLQYGMFFTSNRLGKDWLPSLEPDTEIWMGMRARNFYGSTSQVIVIHMPPNGCLRVLDPAMGDQQTYSRESPFLLDAIPLSNPGLIDIESTHTPSLPFLAEPEHTWCYYFAKAELARQRGEWGKVVELYEEATALGLKPGDAFEWLVFIEAQAVGGNVEAAIRLSEEARRTDAGIRKGLCQVWKRVQSNGPAGVDPQRQIEEILGRLECLR